MPFTPSPEAWARAPLAVAVIPWRAMAAVAILAVALVACAAPPPPPTPVPTAIPTLVPTPTLAPGQPTPEPTALPSEVENAFLSNVDDVIAEAADLSAAPCADLMAVTQANPGLLPSVRGFAATLKRVGASQAVLDTEAVRASLADLDHSMGELEGALSLCGIKQP